MQLQQRGAYRSSLLLCYIAPRLVRRVRDTSFAQNGGGARRPVEWLGRSDPKDRQTVNSENIATYYIHSAHQIIALGEIHLPAGSIPSYSHAQ